MDAILHFSIYLKRCRLFIKASHVGNNFLSAFTPLLNLHVDHKMIQNKIFIMSMYPCNYEVCHAACMHIEIQ